MKIVKEFFYDVFTNYNVQMWGMLASDKLKYGNENAMKKMATDIVHRLVLNSHYCLKADWLPRFKAKVWCFTPFFGLLKFKFLNCLLPTTLYCQDNSP